MTSTARQVIVVGLLLAAIVGLFIAATSGQHQLEEASHRIEQAARRAHALGEDMQLLSQAESGQRGYILLGDPAYLVPYEDAVEKLPAALQRLDAAFASSDPTVQADVDEITKLSRSKFAEMRETLDLYRSRGRGAATALIRSDYGQRTMSQISQRVGRIQAAETYDMLDASLIVAQQPLAESGHHERCACRLRLPGLPAAAADRALHIFQGAGGAGTNRAAEPSSSTWSRSAPRTCRTCRRSCRPSRRKSVRRCRGSCTTNWAACWWRRAWIFPGWRRRSAPRIRTSRRSSNAFRTPCRPG